MMARLKAWLYGAGVWLNALLLAAFPFTDQIMQAAVDYLPGLAPYLPANVYKWVGLAVVVANIVRAVLRIRQLASVKGAAHG